MGTGASRVNTLTALDELQQEIADWRDYNFPSYTAWEQLLGVLEELGEIAHAELKAKQGIRNREADHEDLIKDGVGDLMVFLMGYVQKRGWTLSECLLRAWGEVKHRDWIQYPGTGLPPESD